MLTERELEELRIKFSSDKTYNIMYECSTLLLIRSLLTQGITPAISVVVPAGELQEMKDKLSEWIHKLSNRIIVIDPDGKD